jgi:hypothetical protein
LSPPPGFPNFVERVGCGAIAQLGERYNGIVEVTGSIPVGSTKFSKGLGRYAKPFRFSGKHGGSISEKFGPDGKRRVSKCRASKYSVTSAREAASQLEEQPPEVVKGPCEGAGPPALDARPRPTFADPGDPPLI